MFIPPTPRALGLWLRLQGLWTPPFACSILVTAKGFGVLQADLVIHRPCDLSLALLAYSIK